MKGAAPTAVTVWPAVPGVMPRPSDMGVRRLTGMNSDAMSAGTPVKSPRMTGMMGMLRESSQAAAFRGEGGRES